MSAPAQSWGRQPRHLARQEWPWSDRHAHLPDAGPQGLLAHGMGRSYGDVALNEQGDLLRTQGLDKFIAFDPASGVLRSEFGVELPVIVQAGKAPVAHP